MKKIKKFLILQLIAVFLFSMMPITARADMAYCKVQFSAGEYGTITLGSEFTVPVNGKLRDAKEYVNAIALPVQYAPNHSGGPNNSVGWSCDGGATIYSEKELDQFVFTKDVTFTLYNTNWGPYSYSFKQGLGNYVDGHDPDVVIARDLSGVFLSTIGLNPGGYYPSVHFRKKSFSNEDSFEVEKINAIDLSTDYNSYNGLVAAYIEDEIEDMRQGRWESQPVKRRAIHVKKVDFANKQLNDVHYIDPGFEVKSTTSASLKLNRLGYPYVAYIDTDPSNGNKSFVNVKERYDTNISMDTNWVSVGGGSFLDDPADEDISNLSFDMYLNIYNSPCDTPFVSYINKAGEIKVMKYNYDKKSWEAVRKDSNDRITGAEIASLSVNNNPNSDVDNGTPYIAYKDSSSHKIVVKKYTNNGWTQVGSDICTTGKEGINSKIVLKIDNGVPYVAYQEPDDDLGSYGINGGINGRITVQKFNSSAGTWSLVGQPNFSDRDDGSISFDVNQGDIYVGYETYGDSVLPYDRLPNRPGGPIKGIMSQVKKFSEISNGNNGGTSSPITSVSVTPQSSTVVQGETKQLTATVTTSVEGVIQKVNWTSSDTSGKVTVNSSGLVNVANDAAVGNYTITATSTVDGSKVGSATIVVSQASNKGESSTPTTVEVSVVDGNTGSKVSNITATVTTESNGNKTVAIKKAQALLIKRPDGTVSQLGNGSGISIASIEGAVVKIADDGTTEFKNLPKGTDNNFKISYDLGSGQKLEIGTMKIKVSSNGDISIVNQLNDPYGIVNDAATGKPLSGATTTLYYANTADNIKNGKTPNTAVTLPAISGFAPNDNANPQKTNTNGEYAFMVYPNTDYYIVVTKSGYNSYTTNTTHVGTVIVNNAPINLVIVQSVGGGGGGAVSTKVNHAPTTKDYNIEVQKDTSSSGKVEAKDADNDKLTFTQLSSPSHGSVLVKTDGTWIYVPNKGYTGTDGFMIKVTDGKGGSVISAVDITVKDTVEPVNTSIEETNYNVDTKVNEPINGKVEPKVNTTEDTSYTINNEPINGIVKVNGDGTWNYKPNTDYTGTDSFVVKVSDSKGHIEESTIKVDIKGTEKTAQSKNTEKAEYRLPQTGGALDFKVINTLGGALIGIGYVLTGRGRRKK